MALIFYNPQATARPLDPPAPQMQRPLVDQRPGPLQAITASAEDLTSVLAKDYAQTEQVRVTEALTELQGELAAQREHYMEQCQGKDALDAAERFRDFADQKAQLYAGRFQGQFAGLFKRQAAGLALRHAEEGAAYARRQKAAWEKSVFDAAQTQLDQDIAANLDNPEFLAFRVDAFKRQAAALRPGLDPRALNAQIDASVARTRIEAALAADDLEKAQTALSQTESVLGSERFKWRARIRQELKRRQAQAEADRAKAAREALLGLDDAMFAARYLGDTSELARMADRLRALGEPERAESLTRKVELWNANEQARDAAASCPLPELGQKIWKLDQELKQGRQKLTVSEFQKLERQRETMADMFQDRLKALRGDPALAADVDPQLVYPQEVTPEQKVELRLDYQARNGLGEAGRKPLTASEAAQLREQWDKATQDQRAEMLYGQDGLLASFGSHALPVMAQIGLSSLDQDLAHAVRQDPQALGSARAIYALMALESGDVPGTSQAEDLSEALQASSVYQSYHQMARLTNAPEAFKTLKLYERAASRLLSTGRDPQEAAAMLDARRQGLLEDNMALTIPSGYDPYLIEENLSQALRVRLPALLETRSDLNKFEKAEELARLRRIGIWVNAPSGDGYVFLDPVTGAPVRDGQGQSLKLTLRQASTQPSELERALKAMAPPGRQVPLTIGDN